MDSPKAEQPEQWAVELWDAAWRALDWSPLFGGQDDDAALTIQRAFTERTADLVAAAQGVMPILDGLPMNMIEACRLTECLRQALAQQDTTDAK